MVHIDTKFHQAKCSGW